MLFAVSNSLAAWCFLQLTDSGCSTSGFCTDDCASFNHSCATFYEFCNEHDSDWNTHSFHSRSRGYIFVRNIFHCLYLIVIADLEIRLWFQSTCTASSLFYSFWHITFIFREFGKLCRYAQWDTALKVVYVVFIVAWTMTRLVYFPFWILHSVIIDAPALIQVARSFEMLLLILSLNHLRREMSQILD